MNLSFKSPLGQKPGTLLKMLKASYGELVSSEPERWKSEKANWEEFDRDVFESAETVGGCVFLSWSSNRLVGFASYDPRQQPELGIIGHNCILPEYRRNGFGKEQILEVLRRFKAGGIRKARVSTNEHPFFVPARRMYVSCGFQEVRRIPWVCDQGLKLIEYEKQII